MAKTRTNNSSNVREVTIEELKAEVKKKIIDNYGSLKDFINSDWAKKHGIGHNISTYLSNAGGMSTKLFSDLCEHFEMGKLKRTLKVVRTATYTLEK